MAENLFLRLSDDAEQNIEWLLLDEISGIVRFRGVSDAEEFAGLVADMEWTGSTYVMIKGEQVLLTSADIPSKQQRQIIRAVPFMVEEELATDIDDCFFAIGERDSSGKVIVAVIEETRLQGWVTLLANAGVKPDLLTVDTLSVPRESGCSILLDGDRALIRNDVSMGLVVSTDLLAMTVNLLSDSDKEGLSLLVPEAQVEEMQLNVSQINAEQDINIDVVELEFAPFDALCRGFNKQSINLLQGAYKVETPKSEGSGSWRSVAILAACVFAVQIVLLLGQGIFLDVRAVSYEAQSRSMYKEIFPNDRNVNDLKRRWRSHLGQGGSENASDFLTLFAETAKNIPGTSLKLNNVNFNESRGDLILQLETPRRDQLISFSETLVKLGLAAKIGTINQDDGIVKGSIKVKAPGAR